MPYIKQEDRDRLMKTNHPLNEGDLNHMITEQCIDYLENSAGGYSIYNSIVGVLECVKLEFYRRAVARYEDMKIELNGDVY